MRYDCWRCLLLAAGGFGLGVLLVLTCALTPALYIAALLLVFLTLRLLRR